ncbi:hypothetical protein RhiirC2_710552 [Rhizophagus irregularis]|uniref:MULE transposase domain-containing protein n=1 Tax=Rhizophagus irregularis TaxID=588596 RepID=A0A2N1NEF7_9GLOM|nr:hypothetical protein RhiirC2_710552 [Rhizophagus irregularis]
MPKLSVLVFLHVKSKENAGTNDSGIFICKIEKKTPKLSVSAFLHVKSKRRTPELIISAFLYVKSKKNAESISFGVFTRKIKKKDAGTNYSSVFTFFVCQFKKHNKSSTRKEGIPNEKCRVTKIRPADLCSAKIKVQRYFSKQKVRIERFKDSPDHSHPIEDSEKLKCSEVVRELVMQEAVKNYRPPEIVNAVKDTWLNVMKFLTCPLTDSTHKTNRYDCCLFTIYIRNSYGCWDVGAHFFVSKEDSETVATGLKAIRQFAHRWNLRIGCESLIQEAINECANLTIKKYILRNYAKNTHQWTLWARQHSSPTFAGACNNIVALDDKKRTDSEHVTYEFRTKKFSFIGVDDEILTDK